MSDVAVCTTIFKRIEKLNELLHSIDPEIISSVYIADDGECTDRKDEIYSHQFQFDLEVFDLEFDSGLGAGRHKIVQESNEEFILLMDCDMKMPKNTHVLLEQLNEDMSIGGVCGAFAESERIYTSGCLDIYQEDNVNIDIRQNKKIEFLAGYPFIEFDMIANGAMFRRECLEDYCWDPEYVIGREHADFYIGHKMQTDWKFGLCPSVHFPHNPGGSEDFLSHRWSDDKYRQAEEYLLKKWGFERYNQLDENWLDVYDPRFDMHSNPSIFDVAYYTYKSEGIMSLISSAIEFGKKKL